MNLQRKVIKFASNEIPQFYTVTIKTKDQYVNINHSKMELFCINPTSKPLE